MMTIKEKRELCFDAFVAWLVVEKDNRDMRIHDEDIKHVFTSKMILKKFEIFDIDIVLPDMLLLILDTCVEGNPGQFQVALKDLLTSIKTHKGPIPAGYIVTTEDFSRCFMTEFPIVEIPHIDDKYMKLWDAQKKKNTNTFESDNLCDTPEWWKEVME